MNDESVFAAIISRRTIRRYQDKPVPRAVIERLLEAGIWAPSAHNRQPWRFAVVEDAAQKMHLAQTMGEQLRRDLAADGEDAAAIEADVSRSYNRIVAAPIAIILCLSMTDMDVYPDEGRNQRETIMAVQSVALAGQNILLMAATLGLGVCWMCAPLFCPESVKAALTLPDDWQPQALLTVGYPAEVREKPRRPLAESVVWR